MKWTEVVAVDTETTPIRGTPVPRLICVSIATDRGAFLVGNGDPHLEQTVVRLFAPGHLLVFLNAAFDLHVMVGPQGAFPHLEELAWAKLLAGEVVDVGIREKLYAISTTGDLFAPTKGVGAVRAGYGLDDLAAFRLGKQRGDKKDKSSIRFQFFRFDGWRAQDYPADARAYAIEDAVDTRDIWLAQESVRQPEGRGSMNTAEFQTCAAYALHRMTIEGLRVDQDAAAKLEEAIRAEIEPSERLLIEAGIVTPAERRPHVRLYKKAVELLGHDPGINWSAYEAQLAAQGIRFTGDNETHVREAQAREMVERVCKEHSYPILLSDTGEVSLNAKDVLAPLHGLDPVLDAFKHRQSVQKLLKTEIPRMRNADGTPAERVYSPFNVLVSSGRTSSSADKQHNYPSMNGQNVHPKARECYVADPGWALVSVDYSTLELATTAQEMLDRYGYSSHAEVLRAGRDSHGWLASALRRRLDREWGASVAHLDRVGVYDAFMALKKTDPKTFKFWRTFAKPIGLGFPGRLGPAKIIEIARQPPYEIDFREVAKDMEFDMNELPRAFFWHVENTLKMDLDSFQWTPAAKALALACVVRSLWLEQHPEMNQFFEDVKQQRDPYCWGGVSGEETPEERDTDALCYTSPMGMFRTGCKLTDACNGVAMQTRAAEGAKAAVITLTDRCIRGPLKGIVRPVLFIHDEIVAQVRLDRSEEGVQGIRQAMVDGMKTVVPDVPVGTEAVMMLRWSKEAQPVFDSAGRLIPWEWRESALPQSRQFSAA